MSSETMKALTMQLTRDAYFDPHVTCIVAYTDSNPYVGFLAFKKFPPDPNVSYRDWILKSLNKYYSNFLYWWYGAQIVQKRFHYNELQYGAALYKTGLLKNPKGFIHIHFVCVDPALQGNGVGGYLLDMAHDLADEYQIPCFLMASKMAFKMYEHLGYKTSVIANLVDEDTGELIRESPGMIREPKQPSSHET